MPPGLDAPLAQYAPKSHTPLGSDNPVVAQYSPVGQGRAADMPVVGQYVEMGDANENGTVVELAGQ